MWELRNWTTFSSCACISGPMEGRIFSHVHWFNGNEQIHPFHHCSVRQHIKLYCSVKENWQKGNEMSGAPQTYCRTLRQKKNKKNSEAWRFPLHQIMRSFSCFLLSVAQRRKMRHVSKGNIQEEQFKKSRAAVKQFRIFFRQLYSGVPRPDHGILLHTLSSGSRTRGREFHLPVMDWLAGSGVCVSANCSWSRLERRVWPISWGTSGKVRDTTRVKWGRAKCTARNGAQLHFWMCASFWFQQKQDHFHVPKWKKTWWNFCMPFQETQFLSFFCQWPAHHWFVWNFWNFAHTCVVDCRSYMEELRRWSVSRDWNTRWDMARLHRWAACNDTAILRMTVAHYDGSLPVMFHCCAHHSNEHSGGARGNTAERKNQKANWSRLFSQKHLGCLCFSEEVCAHSVCIWASSLGVRLASGQKDSTFSALFWIPQQQPSNLKKKRLDFHEILFSPKTTLDACTRDCCLQNFAANWQLSKLPKQHPRDQPAACTDLICFWQYSCLCCLVSFLCTKHLSVNANHFQEQHKEDYMFNKLPVSN